MSISESDLKVLWGRAAGRCSLCKICVTEDKQAVTASFPIGENAHIVAESTNGPRGSIGIPESVRNRYWNLILLCPNCHTKVDKSPEDYPFEKLHELKKAHELNPLGVSDFPRSDQSVKMVNIEDKDTYDQFLGFSRITEDNWLSPDRKHYMPFGVSKEQWAASFLEPRLHGNVPQAVIRVFEVARGCMIYSWMFYPLATLGFEQLTRAGAFAIRERTRMLPQEPGGFDDNLRILITTGVVSKVDETRWQSIGELSNERSKSAMMIDPGQAVGILQAITDLINALFETPD